MPPTGRLRGSSPVSPPAPLDDGASTGLSDVIGLRVHVDVMVPRTAIAGSMRLMSTNETTDAEFATLYALRDKGFDDKTPSHIWVKVWNREYNARVMSIAVRDPKDITRPLDSIDEWRECDEDQVVALFVQYNDLAYRLDPLGSTEKITSEELEAIQSAAKKKLADTLLSYGSRKLALFAITLVEQPAS